jgi:hypothetical protein
MSQKAKKFNKTYTITFSGYSRGWENEPTFMETMIDAMINSTLIALSRYKTLKIKTDIK